MAQCVPMIGLYTEELGWIKLLVRLLRHPDPTVPELARQALQYLSRTAENRPAATPETRRAR